MVNEIIGDLPLKIRKSLPYQLIVFNEVIKLGSFTAAANSLGHSKASISQYIYQLEEDLKAKLIERNTRRIRATNIGEEVLLRSQAISDSCRLVKTDIERLVGDISGQLRVTVPHAFQDFIIPNALNKIYERHPKLNIEFIFSDRYISLVEGNIDLAISIGERDNADDKALLINQLTNILVASKSYLNQNSSFTADSLSTHTFIELPWQSRVNPITGKENLSIERLKKIHVNTVTAAISYATKGLGVALLPSIFVNKAVKEQKLVKIMGDEFELKRNVYAIHRFQHSMPNSVKAVLELINESIEKSDI